MNLARHLPTWVGKSHAQGLGRAGMSAAPPSSSRAGYTFYERVAQAQHSAPLHPAGVARPAVTLPAPPPDPLLSVKASVGGWVPSMSRAHARPLVAGSTPRTRSPAIQRDLASSRAGLRPALKPGIPVVLSRPPTPTRSNSLSDSWRSYKHPRPQSPGDFIGMPSHSAETGLRRRDWPNM